ncbi:elongation factor G [Steroidobacter sp. S1-65]|uniref:Elongation factor G n=1 Tax=Steroidobacter gossypii TaxID=2805490 RepID=A0ABS1WS67_9GAMM|nr:elongation factor G [Steroidobacter gossypii]MBM0103825.1 elongation factor G [Steroidobacter gossypii]
MSIPGAHSTSDIRNIALVGQAGAGKTLLTETLLLEAGAIRSRGSLERGTTVCDFDPQEKQLRHSLDAALVHFPVGGCHVQLFDTPGYPDFAGRTLTTLEAVETAGVVVSAVNGIEPMTQRMMDFARDRELCRLVIVNKIDAKDAQPEAVLAQLREMFGRECLPLNLPCQGGKAVVDCFFDPGPDAIAPPDFSSIETAHTEIIDQVVEVDEELMALYLEQGQELSPEQLHDPFERALREGHLVPVCFTSAETGAGIKELLNIFARLMPNPLEGNPPPFLRGEGPDAVRVKVQPDPNLHVIAHVFKVNIDPFVGRLGIFRVHQGTVRSGAQLFIGDARKPFKVAHLYRLQGKDHYEVPQAIPGDICAVPKVEEMHFDAVLHDSHDEDHYHLKSITLPPAMAGVAIEPERRGEEQKLSDALHKLVAEDPGVRIEHQASLNETVLYGMGDLHLRVLLDRMKERYGVGCKTKAPGIPYRETITRPAEGHHRHKKQTGGAGQFGEVYLRVEPLARGEGFEFVDEVVGGVIPSQYIPAVEKGIRQALTEGAVAGFPLQDIRVIVYDGKHHPVDSKEVAFIAAGRRAFLNAVEEAAPIVLEPLVRVEVTSPSAATGDITGDLATRRGRVSGSQSLANQRTRISALVPLAEINDYQSRIKSLTGGEGAYTMELSHYDPVPPRKQQELAQAFKRVAD